MLLNSDVSPWLAVFGRFHIVLLHLPIGLLPAMFLLEFGSVVIRKPCPRGVQLSLALFTVLTAGAALASGLVLAGETEHKLLGDHKVWAIAMTAVCAVLPFVAYRAARMPFRIGLLIALGLSIYTGHLGGSITHRSDWLTKPFDNARQRAQATETKTDEPTPIPTSHFETTIRPILERVCTECHEPEDPDGDLVLTTREGILCLDRDEVDRVIVPGDADASLLIELCELPVDDEDHMPPEDDPQPTKEELAALRAWIQTGASFD